MTVSRLRGHTPDAHPIHEALLISRLRPPRPHFARVDRPRLVQALNQRDGEVVKLIVAPAGYGKSTLLAQWSALAPRPVAWLSLQPDVNDLPLFLTYLVAAIRSVDRSITHIVDPQVTNSRGLMQVVTTLINDLTTSAVPFAIVLDDYHCIESADIHDVMLMLIEHAPPELQIVVGSRAEPPLPLARLRVVGQVATFGVADLRFSISETQALFDSRGVRLTPLELATVHQRTSGWVAGLHMAALGIGDEPLPRDEFISRFGASTRLVADFLLEEVLVHLPDDIRTCLLQTALFERFCLGLYRAVSQSECAQETLEHLVRSNLFIDARDERDGWFTYQQLFRDFLLDRADRELDDATRREWHRRASVWFEEQEQTEQAIQSALAGHDWPRAARLIRPLANDTIGREDVLGLVMAMRALPEDVLEGDPVLASWYAWAAVRAGDQLEADRAIALAERAALASGEPIALASTTFAEVVRYRYQDDGESMMRALDRGIELLDQLDDPRPEPRNDGNDEFRALAFELLSATRWVQHASALRLLGQAHDAEDAALRALDAAQACPALAPYQAATVEHAVVLILRGRLLEAERALRPVITSNQVQPSERRLASLQLAEVFRERGRLDEAERILTELITDLEERRLREWLVQAKLLLARLALTSGDNEAAQRHARAVDCEAASFASDRLSRTARALVAHSQLAQGDIGAALKWSHDSRLAPDDNPQPSRLREHLVFARVLIAHGEADDAVPLLKRLIADGDSDGRGHDVIPALVLLALANQDLFELDEAVTALARALRMAEPGGYLRVFVDEGVPMARLLKVAQRRGVATGYSQHLLVALGEDDVEPAKVYHAELAEPITARELEVLRLIAVGLSNKEIADELFISVSTVKRHITNLYGKLGVSTRTEALQRARQLALLNRSAGASHQRDNALSA